LDGTTSLGARHGEKACAERMGAHLFLGGAWGKAEIDHSLYAATYSAGEGGISVKDFVIWEESGRADLDAGESGDEFGRYFFGEFGRDSSRFKSRAAVSLWGGL
jgi:hypothetical protein